MNNHEAAALHDRLARWHEQQARYAVLPELGKHHAKLIAKLRRSKDPAQA